MDRFTVLLVCLAGLGFRGQHPDAPRPRALTHANAVDARSGSIARDVTLTIRDGRIAALGSDAPPAGYEIVDLDGAYVLTEHGTYLSDATLTLMRENGVFLVPAYDTLTGLGAPGGDYDDPVLMIRAWHMVPRLRTTIEHAHRIGVRLGTGSDTAYGPSSLVRISHEVAYLADMGLTPLEAIQAATITGAELLMIEDRTGAVEPGLEADLLVVNDNPLENLLALQDPLLIVSNGRIALNRLTP